MDLTSGTRNTAVAATLAGVGGFTVTLYGAYQNRPAHSLAGVCITMIALTALILAAIHKWTTNTSTERAILAAAQREAQAERTRYIAAKAALENEQGRLNRDMAAARHRMARDLSNEREAIRAEFEAKRGDLIAETMETTVRMVHQGKFAPNASTSGQLIRFPRQDQSAAPQHERSRERGIVRP